MGIDRGFHGSMASHPNITTAFIVDVTFIGCVAFRFYRIVIPQVKSLSSIFCPCRLRKYLSLKRASSHTTRASSLSQGIRIDFLRVFIEEF